MVGVFGVRLLGLHKIPRSKAWRTGVSILDFSSSNDDPLFGLTRVVGDRSASQFKRHRKIVQSSKHTAMKQTSKIEKQAINNVKFLKEDAKTQDTKAVRSSWCVLDNKMAQRGSTCTRQLRVSRKSTPNALHRPIRFLLTTTPVPY